VPVTLMRTMLNQRGLTYLMALMLVMVMGIMLGMIGQTWKSVMQREREKELIFRLSQIKEAMENWYDPKFPPPGGHKVVPLTKLDDLLQDPSSLTKVRYLRRPYTDPMAPDKKWPDCWATTTTAPMPAPGAAPAPARGATVQGINSVASTSTAAALRVSFAEYSTLATLGTKKSNPLDPNFKERPLQYNDWVLTYDPTYDHSKTYSSYHERW